jgi:hypothetical protein
MTTETYMEPLNPKWLADKKYQFLIENGVTHVINPIKFKQLKGHEPCIATIFTWPDAFGSVLTDQGETYNGTIVSLYGWNQVSTKTIAEASRAYLAQMCPDYNPDETPVYSMTTYNKEWLAKIRPDIVYNGQSSS